MESLNEDFFQSIYTEDNQPSMYGGTDQDMRFEPLFCQTHNSLINQHCSKCNEIHCEKCIEEQSLTNSSLIHELSSAEELSKEFYYKWQNIIDDLLNKVPLQSTQDLELNFYSQGKLVK